MNHKGHAPLTTHRRRPLGRSTRPKRPIDSRCPLPQTRCVAHETSAATARAAGIRTIVQMTTRPALLRLTTRRHVDEADDDSQGDVACDIDSDARRSHAVREVAGTARPPAWSRACSWLPDACSHGRPRARTAPSDSGPSSWWSDPLGLNGDRGSWLVGRVGGSPAGGAFSGRKRPVGTAFGLPLAPTPTRRADLGDRAVEDSVLFGVVSR
jgi:hypothetical protein